MELLDVEGKFWENLLEKAMTITFEGKKRK